MRGGMFEYLGPMDYPEDEGEYPPEPPIRNVTNMEQYRGNPNTVFIDEPARQIREYGQGGEVLSEDQMPRRSEERMPSKPDAKEFDIFTQFKDFEKQWLPQAQAEADGMGEQAAQEYITKNWDVKAMTEKALSFGDEKVRIQETARLIKEKTAQKHITELRKAYTPLFKEAYGKEALKKAADERVRQEGIRDARELAQQKERETRLEAARDQNRAEILADRRKDAAEKATEKASSDAEKKLERDIKAAEGRSVDIKWLDKRLIEVNEKAKAEGFEPDANSMQALNDIAAKNGKRIEKWQGKKGGYSTLFGDIGREEYAFYALVDKNAPKGQQPQAEPASVQSSVKAGEVRKGYKFKGGNPADRNNWEKI